MRNWKIKRKYLSSFLKYASWCHSAITWTRLFMLHSVKVLEHVLRVRFVGSCSIACGRSRDVGSLGSSPISFVGSATPLHSHCYLVPISWYVLVSLTACHWVSVQSIQVNGAQHNLHSKLSRNRSGEAGLKSDPTRARNKNFHVPCDVLIFPNSNKHTLDLGRSRE